MLKSMTALLYTKFFLDQVLLLRWPRASHSSCSKESLDINGNYSLQYYLGLLWSLKVWYTDFRGNNSIFTRLCHCK